MFRIEAFVDDRKLGEALRALVGLAHGSPNVQPVENAKVVGNGIKAMSQGGAMEQFLKLVKTLKKDTSYTSSDIQTLMKTAKLNPTSFSYFAGQAVRAGILRKYGSGSGMSYKMVSK